MRHQLTWQVKEVPHAGGEHRGPPGLKVASPGAELNDLAVQGRQLGAALSRAVIARCLWTMQERELRRVRVGARELACPGCGVVHRGPGSLLRRGRRARCGR